MDPKALLYIVIGIVYLFAQYRKAQKKRAQQNQRGQGNDNTLDNSTPIQPPTPQKDRDTFISVFEDLQQQMRDKKEKEAKRIPDQLDTLVDEPQRPSQQFAPISQKDGGDFKNIFESAQDQLERRRDEDRKKTDTPKRFAPPPRREYVPVKPVKEELDENYHDDTMQDMIKYETLQEAATAQGIPASVNYADDLTNPILNDFDLRNALIAQIILERSEF